MITVKVNWTVKVYKVNFRAFIAKRCHQHRVPVIAIAGMADPLLPGFDQIYTLTEYAGNPKTSIQYPEPYLRRIAKDLKRDILKLI